jgi:hypothetical protein
MKNYRVDVWHGEGIMTYEGSSLIEGKNKMRKLKKQGEESIRMYADGDDEGDRWYYRFKGNRIVRESNNLDN